MVTGIGTHCVINPAKQPSNESQRVAATEENISESNMLNPNRVLTIFKGTSSHCSLQEMNHTFHTLSLTPEVLQTPAMVESLVR